VLAEQHDESAESRRYLGLDNAHAEMADRAREVDQVIAAGAS
jgi:hypothetical protein